MNYHLIVVRIHIFTVYTSHSNVMFVHVIQDYQHQSNPRMLGPCVQMVTYKTIQHRIVLSSLRIGNVST